MMTDPKLIQFVDTPFDVTYSAAGEAYVQWPQVQGILSVNGYSQISVMVGPSAHTQTYDVIMGKISGATLSSKVAAGLHPGLAIHTYSVVGPEFAILLHGTAGSQDQVQLWIYLRP